MRSHRRCAGRLALIACACWFGLLACASGTAVPARGANAQSAVGAASEPGPASPTGPRHVTVLVLDMSRSMRGNDPDDIRCAAARTFIALGQPGELVGLIGFKDAGAQVWHTPIETTAANQAVLEKAVGDNCQKLGVTTPTYQALDEAYRQLDSVPGDGARSAVLLTDGVPDPGGPAEIGRIETQLVPRFQQRGWRIDTVGVGTGDVDFTFLGTLARDTRGQHYDSSQGHTATAFNLLPALVDVLRDELGRDPGADDFSESVGSHVFSVTPAARRLDVIVVCTQACPRVTLRTPNGDAVEPVIPVSAGASRPAIGAVFSLPNPVPSNAGSTVRPWTVTNPDSGRFQVASLVDLQLRIALRLAPPFPIDRGVPLKATVQELDGTPYPALLSVTGSIDGGGVHRGFTLGRDPDGIYSGSADLPDAVHPGDYTINVQASRTRTDEPLATAARSFKVGAFPRPEANRLTGSATVWPGWVTALYSLPLADRFSGWALGGSPLLPTASVTGAVKGPNDTSYDQRPLVSAQAATRPGGTATTPVPAGAAGPGRFWLRIPTPSAGNYAVALHTGGPESFGETVTTDVVVGVTVQPASAGQILHAAAATATLAGLLCLVVMYLRFCLMRPPFGELRANAGDDAYPLTARRSIVRAFLLRDRLVCREPDGLAFKFSYRSGIRVRADRRQGGHWQREDGGELSSRYSHEFHLVHDGAGYTIVDDEDLNWRHGASVLARALGLPVRVPRVADDDQELDGDGHFTY